MPKNLKPVVRKLSQRTVESKLHTEDELLIDDDAKQSSLKTHKTSKSKHNSSRSVVNKQEEMSLMKDK